MPHALLPLREIRDILISVFRTRTVCVSRYGQKAHLSPQVRQNLQQLSRKFSLSVALAVEVGLSNSFLALSSVNQNLSNCFSILFSAKAVNLELKNQASMNCVANAHRRLYFNLDLLFITRYNMLNDLGKSQYLFLGLRITTYLQV